MNTLRQKNNKVVFLFGPTAVGKTDLLCSLFVSGHEVVNADSVQVYKGLDIGSAKADEEVLSKIKHHLVNVLQPWETFNVATFISMADRACEEIRANGNIPVVSGGTAFYFKNFMYGLSKAPQCTAETREKVARYISENGNAASHEYLCSIDPVSGARINVNDTYRISRALEVYLTCGQPLSSFPVPDKPRNNMDVLIIGLERDREELRQRIAKRVDLMFETGLVDEIERLIQSGASLKWQSMQAIGYSQFFRALESCSLKDIDIKAVKQQIVTDSIHYAKRQMTFFNSFKDVHWCHPEDINKIRELVTTFENS